MAIIYSYPLVNTLRDSDLFPLTATNAQNELYTVNVSFPTLASEIIDEAFNGTDSYIPKFNGTSSLVDSVIYQDSDGHIGVGVTGSPPNPVHKFEVFDLRDENTSSDYSSVVTTHVNTPFTGGGGGILSRLSIDGGSTHVGQIALVPGTIANDLSSNTKLAFYANSNMDTNTPSNLVGAVTNDGTNAHWILGGTINDTTTTTLKVNGTSEFTDSIIAQNIQLGGTGASNRLDDYEKGTFTPNLIVTGTNTSINNVLGRYTKIGDLVHVEILIQDVVPENETTTIQGCTNLPFVIANTSFTSFAIGQLLNTSNFNLGRGIVYGINNSTTITFYDNGLYTSLATDTDVKITINLTYTAV